MNCRTFLLPALAAGLLATALSAQNDQEKLVALRDQKLASPFLKNGAWLTDYDQARAAAKESGKPIFAYFTRSFSP